MHFAEYVSGSGRQNKQVKIKVSSELKKNKNLKNKILEGLDKKRWRDAKKWILDTAYRFVKMRYPILLVTSHLPREVSPMGSRGWAEILCPTLTMLEWVRAAFLQKIIKCFYLTSEALKIKVNTTVMQYSVYFDFQRIRR